MISSARLLFLGVAVGALAFPACVSSVAQQGVHHPSMQSGSPAPLFDTTIAALRADVGARLQAEVPVPQPVDAGGGYTHEQHKQNGKTIYDAGMLYRLTGDVRYRDFAATILQDYAELYPTLGLHPERKGQTAGKLFWQSLNEAVWLVYAIQGYEQIRSDLGKAERDSIEVGVFRPMARYLSDESPQTFDRIHNHGTWAAAAVGMTGYVLGDRDMVEKALLGLDKSGTSGFLKQLDVLFSPDGYYAEGPYYQRYALMPFVLFAQAVHKNEPERKIFEHRDGVLLKAILSTVQQTYAGRFFPLNDAIREKGLNTAELRYAIAIAYSLTEDPALLDVVSMQRGVVPTSEGRKLAEAIAAGKAKPFPYASTLLRDGPDGKDGALAILRSGPEPDSATIVFKATSQGMEHGHLDRLGLLYFDNGDEIVADYGAARFLNVEPKDGGRYLPENDSWAQQTVAHNTLVVDLASQFGGRWQSGEGHSPTLLAFANDTGVAFSAAEIETAYEGVRLQRLVGLVGRADGGSYVVDVVRARSENEHTYDLPVHFKGQLIETGFKLDVATQQLNPLGTASGYQHLWKKGESGPIADMAKVSWLLGDQFYTMAFKSSAPVTAIMTELGANDPNDNLRTEQVLILRAAQRSIDLVSVYERHGRYDNDEEITVFDGGSVSAVTTERVGEVSVYIIATDSGSEIRAFFADDTSPARAHCVQLGGVVTSWTGAVHMISRSGPKSNTSKSVVEESCHGG